MSKESVLTGALLINLLLTCMLIISAIGVILSTPEWPRMSEPTSLSMDIYGLVSVCGYAALQLCVLVWRPKV